MTDPNNIQERDQIINVTLSKEDYTIMRDMIEKQKSLNWLGKYIRTVIFVAIGGLVTLFVFGEQLRKLLASFISYLAGPS
jgi:hypothetical protein